MHTHLESELEAAKLKIFQMADISIESIRKSVDALVRGDETLAFEVIEKDQLCDTLEVSIDEECIRIIATRQPAASDLRFVLSILKTTTDLERIGDHCTAIAREAINIKGKRLASVIPDIQRSSEIAIEMGREVFLAISERDVQKARHVIERDSEINALNIKVTKELFGAIGQKGEIFPSLLSHVLIIKSLERVGDHFKNIAERAIYYIEGIDIRHNS